MNVHAYNYMSNLAEQSTEANTLLAHKSKRCNILELKEKPEKSEKFGIFVMALKNLEESDDWYRICGIHGDTFKPNDPEVLCPTDQKIVAAISQTGEPFYCKHSVYSFIAWHTPYVYQFELLLNKYNKSSCKDYITLPYIDLTNTTSDFAFMNEPTITVLYEGEQKTIENPLAGAYYYVDGVKTKTTRNGFLTPTTKKQAKQLNTVKKQLNNVLYAGSYERFSSHPVTYYKMDTLHDYIPLETPHNSLHDIIGGDGGNMSDISISAFDPIFWLHHCNMDRHFYTWLYTNTHHFTRSIHPEKIMHQTYESTQAPFVKHNIYEADFNTYTYGWKNPEIKYMLLKDMLDVQNFPFTYDIIEPKLSLKLLPTSFVELIDIPIPRESMTISVYIHLKTEELDRDNNFAGSASWFGVNRAERTCERCQVTRTNMNIDIDDYVKENNITKDNIDNYNIVIQGEGKLIKGALGYHTYTREELVADGAVEIVI